MLTVIKFKVDVAAKAMLIKFIFLTVLLISAATQFLICK